MTAGMIAAYTMSRASPVIRDSSVVTPTMAVLRKKPRLMAAGVGCSWGLSWGGNGSEKA